MSQWPSILGEDMGTTRLLFSFETFMMTQQWKKELRTQQCSYGLSRLWTRRRPKGEWGVYASHFCNAWFSTLLQKCYKAFNKCITNHLHPEIPSPPPLLVSCIHLCLIVKSYVHFSVSYFINLCQDIHMVIVYDKIVFYCVYTLGL